MVHDRPPWENAEAALCGSIIVRPMPIFEEGGFTTTMGGGTGTAVTDQTPEAEQAIAKEFLAFAKLTNEAQKALYTDLGFDPFRNDVYDDPALLTTNDCFSGEVPFEIIKSELGNVAPDTWDRCPQRPAIPGGDHDHAVVSGACPRRMPWRRPRHRWKPCSEPGLRDRSMMSSWCRDGGDGARRSSPAATEDIEP